MHVIPRPAPLHQLAEIEQLVSQAVAPLGFCLDALIKFGQLLCKLPARVPGILQLARMAQRLVDACHFGLAA